MYYNHIGPSVKAFGTIENAYIDPFKWCVNKFYVNFYLRYVEERGDALHFTFNKKEDLDWFKLTHDV